MSTSSKTQPQKPVQAKKTGTTFKPFFVTAGENPYSQVKWTKRSSSISDASGGKVFQAESVEVPEAWSQLATDIAVSKYFRRAGVPKTGGETSVRQLVHRVAHTIAQAGEQFGGYFATAKDAEQFEKELVHILLTQKGAFNSPVWFNCGLHQEYGIQGSGGSFAWSFKDSAPRETLNSYENPQCSACFIQSVDDDLMSIFDLVKNEARIFKFGSGTGTNFSKIRGSMEKLSGGGTSSGLMSFLEVLDRGAGATKSGGTTRRAAKMVSLDMDHPEISEFINWKAREEKKVGALIGAGYSADFNGEAYRTVSGQNSNNSVRIPDSFMKAVESDGDWNTTARTDGRTIATYRARDLWNQISQAAWDCADPGVQFDSTIQKWHTCAETDRINGSNPCSEYMFLDDSACNLSSLNLVKFVRDDGSFDIEAYRHAARILFTAQEILVDFSSYPTKQIAQNSHDFRPLGLGFANLGTLLMIKGVPYDSEAARAWAGALTALMHGEAFRTSAEMASSKGAFAGYEKNAQPMLRVMKQHQKAVDAIDRKHLPKDLMAAVTNVWREVIETGAVNGFRNAQATVLAPTGTIGLLMDCDTTGIEPDFALVKFKKLAGGGYFKIVNQSVPKALKALGYTDKQVREIIEYAVGTMSLESLPYINTESLKRAGANAVDLQKISAALPSAFDLSAAVAPWVLGEDGMARLGLVKEDLNGATVLEALGFTHEQITIASSIACGRMTVEGAPHLKSEHLAVFDCANKCGLDGQRYLSPMSHVHMMAAAQPFLSGAISKTVNMPNEATVAEIADVYHEAWKLGVKAVAIYRDGSKMAQVLSGKGTESKKAAETSAPSVNERGEALMYSQKDLEDAVARAVAVAPARKAKLPQRRPGITVESRVGDVKVFLRTGEYEDGRLGEIFIDVAKEGATLRSLMNCFAISISTGLQYGVPLEDYVDKFTFTRFEPAGFVNHPNIKQATSLIDYVFRVLGFEYLGRTDFVQVKPAADQLSLPLEKASVPQAEAREALMKEIAEANAEAIRIAKQAADSGSAPEPLPSRRQLIRQMNQHSKFTSVELGASGESDPLNAQLSKMMGDAPMCSTCGHVTVRNGTCYRCLNCGNSMGCS
jgi:ribonucleoside-diphosphate reductase alpha chain